MGAIDALKAFVIDIVLPYLVPLLGLLLAVIATVIPALDKRAAKREVVCAVIKSVPTGQGREVTIRVTNTGHAQLIPGEQARIRFFFGRHAVIHQATPGAGIRAADLSIENNHLLVTPPFLNAKDFFLFHVHLQGHHLFKASSQVEGIQRIWWEHPVNWRRRIINLDLLAVGYDLFIVIFLFTLPWQVTVFRAVAPFAWILKTPFYPFLLFLCIGFLALSFWLYFSRLVKKSEKSLHLVVKRTHYP